MSTPTNKPAFPLLDNAGSGLALTDPGMDLRDYFAAKVMHAAMSSEAAMQAFRIDEALDRGDRAWDAVARGAYDVADAMLKARES